MTKFTALSGTVSNGNASPDDQAKVFRFSGASSTSEAREETKTSTGLGLIYGRSYADDMITLRVGPEATPFKVHMSMLTRASKVFHAMFKQQFQGATTREATLDDDDANAWGLIMDWLYTESLPEFDPLYLKSQATKRQRASGKQACSIGLPLPSRFGKPAYTFDSECFVNGVRMIPVSTSTTGPRRCDIQHICAQEPYTNFSIDELRLLERYRSFPEEAGSYASYVNRGFQPLGTATDNEQQPETEEQEECGRQLMDTTLDDEEDYERHLQAMLDHLVTNEQIPMPIPFPSFIEAEFLQLTLLNVLLIADKYCWDDLFNDAMDVYRKGEERLARPHPVLRHIELAYRHCPSSSPLVTLLADTAFYQGQANQSSSEMAEFGLVCKEFWEDVMARQEGKISVPGFNRYGGIRTSKSPLSRAGGTVYHRHGRNWNKGECPRSCEQRRRERL
jgi:RNAse (barnase) inhibitor barstar